MAVGDQARVLGNEFRENRWARVVHHPLDPLDGYVVILQHDFQMVVALVQIDAGPEADGQGASIDLYTSTQLPSGSVTQTRRSPAVPAT